VGASKAQKLVGTSTALEKEYLRLTTFPKPENVRPLKVLIQSLAHVKSRFIKTEDFDWANEQLKSIRQDITVQRIRNKFTLEVYETHARLLLEHGDLNEFHQCQSMIRSLTTGHKGAADHGDDPDDTPSSQEVSFMPDVAMIDPDGPDVQLKQNHETADEFRAYGLLYALVQNSWSELTRTLSHAASVLAPGPSSEDSSSSSADHDDDDEMSDFLRGSAFRHAIRVVKAVLHNDYQAFFRLYSSAPHLSAFLMDFLVLRVRSAGYERMIAAYRPTLSVEQVRETLFFSDLEETRRFLKKSGAVFIQELGGGPPFYVDCKSSASKPKKKKST
jgi:SAC3 family protein LENG8/THP3